ncbi:DNA repair protein recA homolog 2, mitochondrial-like, partial [Impatiens glandulifera]
VAALIPGKCIDALAGEDYKISQSRIMTQALRKIQSSLCNFETLVIFINQVRSKVTSNKGFKHAEIVTCGGNALPFYAAVRLRIFRTGLLKMNDEVTGVKINVQVVKNKLAPPMKKADIEILFGKGICCVSEVLELASEYSVISRENGHYLMDGRVFRTKQEAEGYLVENSVRLEEMVKSLRTLLFSEIK